MLWGKLFTPIKTLEPEEVRDYISRNGEGTYALIDVRQPDEYEKEHLPGARLIPLAVLADTFNELDPLKPTIVY